MRPDRTRTVSNAEAPGVTGAVVVVDVIRAFTTAACALDAGARAIRLVGTVEEALRFKADNPGALAMGEVGGLMPGGFDLPNSPARASTADLDGRFVVHRTSAGTQGVVAAVAAERLWCASLVVASATAASVTEAGLGPPTYVVTGRSPDAPASGADDAATAEHIEAIRAGTDPDPATVAAVVSASDEAARTLALGSDHVDPADIAIACDVDRFAFAMEVDRSHDGLWLRPSRP